MNPGEILTTREQIAGLPGGSMIRTTEDRYRLRRRSDGVWEVVHVDPAVPGVESPLGLVYDNPFAGFGPLVLMSVGTGPDQALTAEDLDALAPWSTVKSSVGALYVKSEGQGLWVSVGSTDKHMPGDALLSYSAPAAILLVHDANPNVAHLRECESAGTGERRWALTHPDGVGVAAAYTDDEARGHGYTIPEPEELSTEEVIENVITALSNASNPRALARNITSALRSGYLAEGR